LALKLDVPDSTEQRFEPRFDPYLDGDHGDVGEAIEYLLAKTLNNSAQAPTSTGAAEKVAATQSPPPASQAAGVETSKVEQKKEELSDIDLLRVRLWRARASHSRQAGLALVILSAALFAGAFFTAGLILEVGSVSSFVIGVGLLAYEAEPRVKLFPSISSMVGPLKAVQQELVGHGVSDASAVFQRSVPEEGGRELMTFETQGEDAARYSIPPLGDGLVHAYELELGELEKLKLDGARVWLPRVIVEGLGLADRIEMKSSGNEVTTVIEKPFVRALCVQDFMVKGLCRTSGCPLAASVGQALAKASGKPVTHGGCTYDPLTQRATLKDTIAP
jgi:hypothetical protein